MAENLNSGNSDKAGDKAGGMRGWLKVVLFGSLALNLLIIGLVVGAMARFDQRDGKEPRFDRLSGSMTWALPRADRREIGEALRKDFRAKPDAHALAKSEYDIVISALRGVPFDASLIEQTLRRQTEAGRERQLLGQQLLLARLIAMDDAERAEFADNLAKIIKRGPRRDRR
jgi:uncharacterized membrane protein